MNFTPFLFPSTPSSAGNAAFVPIEKESDTPNTLFQYTPLSLSVSISDLLLPMPPFFAFQALFSMRSFTYIYYAGRYAYTFLASRSPPSKKYISRSIHTLEVDVFRKIVQLDFNKPRSALFRPRTFARCQLVA